MRPTEGAMTMPSIAELEVRHLARGRPSAEVGDDLEVLRRFHQLVRHVTSVECRWCHGIIRRDDDDAIKKITACVEGPNLREIEPEELVDNVCGYYDYVMHKD